MIRTHYSTEIKPAMDGKKVTVAGWVQHNRILGNIGFLKIRDREGLTQVAVSKNNPNFSMLKEITPESVVAVTGKVKKSSQAAGGFEIIPDKLELLSKAEVPLPIDFSGKVDTGLSKRLDHRYMDLRNPKNLLIYKVLSTAENAMREYCLSNGFIEINTPKMMAAPSESGAEIFEVKYFKRKAYLAQSPQFYKQMGIASGFDKVFELSTVFRADPSHTTRHTTEFSSFDLEVGFVDSVEDIMKIQENLLKHVFEQVKKRHGSEIKELFNIDIEIPKTPFPRITMAAAVKEIHDHFGEVDEFYELDPEGEKKLGEYIKKKHNHGFVFLTEFPYDFRPFYHMKKAGDGKLTESYDLIYKGVEIVTGSLREHRYDTLLKQAKEKGIDPKNIGFYLNFFRYGCPPHGGFGLGPARLVMKMLDLSNIRETTFLPRDTDRLTP